MLHLILGGTTLQRCGNCFVLSSALAAEVALSAQKLVFPQAVQLCRSGPSRMRALAPAGRAAPSGRVFMKHFLGGSQCKDCYLRRSVKSCRNANGTNATICIKRESADCSQTPGIFPT